MFKNILKYIMPMCVLLVYARLLKYKFNLERITTLSLAIIAHIQSPIHTSNDKIENMNNVFYGV